VKINIATAQIQHNKLCIWYFCPYSWARNGLFKVYAKTHPNGSFGVGKHQSKT